MAVTVGATLGANGMTSAVRTATNMTTITIVTIAILVTTMRATKTVMKAAQTLHSTG